MVRLLILPLLSLATLGACFPSNPVPLETIQHLIQTAVKIELHNSNASKTFKLKFSEISALTPEQYKMRLGFRQDITPVAPPVRTFNKYAVNDVPASMDWREKGAVSPIKDQSHCRSCWAFSAVGALEGQHAIKKGKLVEFSEQNLIDCDDKDYGCGGGRMDNAFNFVKNNKGIDTEDAYPYNGDDETCRFRRESVGETDSGFEFIHSGDEEALKTAVASIGPISVGIDASLDTFHHYGGGVYHDEKCSSVRLDHAVLVVGYGTDAKEGDYWIVKNSYGTSWGEAGYIRMARNKGNLCGIASFALYPVVE